MILYQLRSLDKYAPKSHHTFLRITYSRQNIFSQHKILVLFCFHFLRKHYVVHTHKNCHKEDILIWTNIILVWRNLGMPPPAPSYPFPPSPQPPLSGACALNYQLFNAICQRSLFMNKAPDRILFQPKIVDIFLIFPWKHMLWVLIWSVFVEE